MKSKKERDIIKRFEHLQDHLIKVQQRNVTKSTNNAKNNKNVELCTLPSKNTLSKSMGEIISFLEKKPSYNVSPLALDSSILFPFELKIQVNCANPNVTFSAGPNATSVSQ